ncbi:MAG: hypothetical protein PUI06_05125 [Prevotella sp.]|nr:hypothetical protein [Prevotella sp.]
MPWCTLSPIDIGFIGHVAHLKGKRSASTYDTLLIYITLPCTTH